MPLTDEQIASLKPGDLLTFDSGAVMTYRSHDEKRVYVTTPSGRTLHRTASGKWADTGHPIEWLQHVVSVEPSN